MDNYACMYSEDKFLNFVTVLAEPVDGPPDTFYQKIVKFNFGVMYCDDGKYHFSWSSFDPFRMDLLKRKWWSRRRKKIGEKKNKSKRKITRDKNL